MKKHNLKAQVESYNQHRQAEKRLKQLQKELDKLESSRKTRFIRFMMALFGRTVHTKTTLRREIYVQELLLQNERLTETVADYEATEGLLMRVQQPSEQLSDQLKRMRRSENAWAHTERLLKRLEQTQVEMGKVTAEFVKQFYAEKGLSTWQKYVFTKLIQTQDPGALPEKLLRNLDEATVSKAFSFRRQLAMHLLKQTIGLQAPEAVVDNKAAGYRFADLLGVKRPVVYAENKPERELRLRKGTVTKPANGAGGRGVYIVDNHLNIRDIKSGDVYENEEEMRQSMRNQLKNGAVPDDSWTIEQYVGDTETDRDLKFYCFYGKVGVVLEVQRTTDTVYSWYDESGSQLDTGKYTNRLIDGTGFSPELKQLAEKMSRELPVPFMRIDFIQTDEHSYFGEFTPKPGNFEEMNDKTDTQLGYLFAEAEERLKQDLLNGKSFQAFRQLTTT